MCQPCQVTEGSSKAMIAAFFRSTVPDAKRPDAGTD
jgi:hypothetical protein